MSNLIEAAQILARGVNSIGVYGEKNVTPSQVEQITEEWLEMKAALEPPSTEETPKRFWKRLFSTGAG